MAPLCLDQTRCETGWKQNMTGQTDATSKPSFSEQRHYKTERNEYQMQIHCVMCTDWRRLSPWHVHMLLLTLMGGRQACQGENSPQRTFFLFDISPFREDSFDLLQAKWVGICKLRNLISMRHRMKHSLIQAANGVLIASDYPQTEHGCALLARKSI